MVEGVVWPSAGGEFWEQESAEEVAGVPNSSIKNEKMYRDLRKQGDSKEKAARISNAAAGKGASAQGRKAELVSKLRNH